MNHIEVFKQFDELNPRLAETLHSLEEKLRSILSREDLKVYSVEGRIKDPESFRRKLSRPDRTYKVIEDITDILGIRVITYFEDSVEEIGRLIEENFTVDYSNSTNKLRSLDNQSFGYRSLHYVCFYPEIPPLRFEIQIRTVLQHAWAEIEHDLGYKSIAGVPGVIRRRFSQIASILEIADREFVAIRKDVSEYEKGIRQSAVDGAEGITLDLVSLQAMLSHESIRKLDNHLVAKLKLPVSEDAFFPEYLLNALTTAGLTTSKKLFEAVTAFETKFPLFLDPYFKFAKTAWNFQTESITSVKRGYSLLFIAHLAMLDSEPLVIDKVIQAARFYQHLDYPNSPSDAAVVGRQLVESLQTAGFFA